MRRTGGKVTRKNDLNQDVPSKQQKKQLGTIVDTITLKATRVE
jgi:hypothetical protein